MSPCGTAVCFDHGEHGASIENTVGTEVGTKGQSKAASRSAAARRGAHRGLRRVDSALPNAFGREGAEVSGGCRLYSSSEGRPPCRPLDNVGSALARAP